MDESQVVTITYPDGSGPFDVGEPSVFFKIGLWAVGRDCTLSIAQVTIRGWIEP